MFVLIFAGVLGRQLLLWRRRFTPAAASMISGRFALAAAPMMYLVGM